MSTQSQISPTIDPYCQLCSSKSSSTKMKSYSSFTCDHCQLLLCYNCYETHHKQLLTGELNQSSNRFFQLLTNFQKKKQLYSTFEEHCLRSMNSTFDDIITDIEHLRQESINYVKQQFHETDNILSNAVKTLQPLSLSKSHENLSNNFDIQQQQMHIIDNYLDLFSSPKLQFQISTFPRNKFDLQCQLLPQNYQPLKPFLPSYPGRIVTTKCTCHQQTEYTSEKIDVDTEVEEINETNSTLINHNSNNNSTHNNHEIINYGGIGDEDEYFSVQDETSDLSTKVNQEFHLSQNYESNGTITTQNEVDRLASDGEHILYYSETSKSLCYVVNFTTDKQTKEITCHWPHYPILDLVYSPVSTQFICATKTGVYTCSIDTTNHSLSLDIQMQLTQHWSYIRLSADRNYLWIWTDTPRSSQLAIYSPTTFDLVKTFHLNDYPRFSDNSTSFCIDNHFIATVFQYKQIHHNSIHKKYFHVTFCDSTDLHELCTIRLGECDIDHEIRSNNDGEFFITNGKKILWIIDPKGRKEYVSLVHTGRALTVLKNQQILIANGTQYLQCIEHHSKI